MNKLQQMVERLVSTISEKGSRTGGPRGETREGDEGEFGGNVQTECGKGNRGSLKGRVLLDGYKIEKKEYERKEKKRKE